ncbi:hypothetical protein RZS08_37815, partial [Arthrospira platensis SPKY1]|nr:hypothetical protein [Arthrospira platensis SPKY1]
MIAAPRARVGRRLGQQVAPRSVGRHRSRGWWKPTDFEQGVVAAAVDHRDGPAGGRRRGGEAEQGEGVGAHEGRGAAVAGCPQQGGELAHGAR